MKELIRRSQAGDEESLRMLIKLFVPLINKYSYIAGQKDEDLYSELLMAFFKCVKKFEIDEYAYVQKFNLEKFES